jgi:hypothetical protein
MGSCKPGRGPREPRGPRCSLGPVGDDPADIGGVAQDSEGKYIARDGFRLERRGTADSGFRAIPINRDGDPKRSARIIALQRSDGFKMLVQALKREYRQAGKIKPTGVSCLQIKRMDDRAGVRA